MGKNYLEGEKNWKLVPMLIDNSTIESDVLPAVELKFVSIKGEKIRDLAFQLILQGLKAPDWRIPKVHPESNEAFISQLFYLCAVDFAFTSFDGKHEKYNFNGEIKGSSGCAACFVRHFGEETVYPQEILEITAFDSEIKKFFRGLNEIPIIGERRENLREAAASLLDHFSGEANRLVVDSRFSVENLVKLLTILFPRSFGGDVYSIKLKKEAHGEVVFRFDKRAQLFALCYQGRALHSNGELPLLKDPENIGPICDYEVPNGLRHLGIIEYKDELREKIDNWLIIPKGSREELEIRLATVYVMKKLLDAVNELLREKLKPEVTMVELDYAMWNLGRESSYPHHLTITTDY